MTSISSLQDVLDDGFLLVTDRQRHLADLVGPGTPFDAAQGGRYDVDFGVGTLTFSGPAAPAPLTVRAHLVGSAAPGPASWLWGWENVNGFPEPLIAYARHVRDFGEKVGLAELTQAQIPLSADPRETAQMYASVASTVCGGMTIYTCEVGGGTVVAMLLDGPELTLPPASILRLTTLVPEVLSTGAVSDWRRALRSYAAMRGVALDEQEGSMTFTAADGAATITFDELGRVSGIRGSMG